MPTPKTRHTLRRLLARRARQERRKRDWSQEQLGQISGLHRTYVSLIERGRCNVSIDNLERLAEALDLSVAELLTPSAVPEPDSVLARLARPAVSRSRNL